MRIIRNIFFFLVGTCAIVVTTVFCFSSYLELQKIERLINSGKVVDAIVERVEYKKVGRTRVDNDFKASISFQVEDHRTVYAKIDIEGAQAIFWKESASTPKTIKVRYLPENPDIIIQDGYQRMSPLVTYSLMVMMIFGSIGAIYIMLKF